VVRFHTVVLVLTWVAACGSQPSGPKTTQLDPPATPPPVEPIAIADAGIVDAAPPPSKLVCDPGTSVIAAPAPEPTWLCAKPDGTKHGRFITLFPDGEIAISGLYKDGLLDGAWERKHPNGAIAERGTYANAMKHGTWTQFAPSGKQLGTYEMAMGTGVERRWFDDGTLYSEISFKAGLEHGPAKLYTEDGTIITSSQFENGKLDGAHVVGTSRTMRFEEKFSKGVRTGKREIWEDHTQIAAENYDRRGKLDGDYTLWRKKTITRVEGKFDHGKRVGAWVWHDRDGNTEREGSYVDGKKDGDWIEYADGKVVFTGHYTAGMQDGDFTYFDRNGNELGKFTMIGGTGTMVTFWGNKRPSSKTRMVKGVEDGLYQELTTRGKVIVEGRYRGGKKHGVWKEWTADGHVLVLQQTWKRGKLDGSVKKFVDGKLSLEATYLAGQVAGVYTEHRNGKPAVTGSYVADRKTGTWTHYAADGSVALVATYKSGVLDGPWRQLVDGSVLEGTMRGGRRTGTWTLTDKAGSVKQLVYTTP
jgi:antitoxin component YwqK of YwqJK toxin-antitoxin module